MLDALTWTAIGGCAVGVIGAFVAAFKARAETKAKTRADAISEYTAVIARQDTEIALQRKRMDELTTQVFELLRKSADCQAREADLKAELIGAYGRIKILESATGLAPPPLPVPGVILVDQKSCIRVFSPTLASFLMYLPKEIEGKPLETLFARGQLDVSKALDGSDVPDPNKDILTYARNKNGEPVPVTLNVSAWKVETDALVTVYVRLRASGSTGGQGSR